MQIMGVTGKIYGLKSGQTNNGKDKVSFRLGVRKQFVTDQDRQDGKTLTFMPMVAMGPTAKFITDYFNEGDMIVIGDMEYQTYRTQHAPNEFDDAHIFKIGRAGFASDGSGGNGNGGSQRQQNNNYNNNNNNNGNGGSYNQRGSNNNQRPQNTRQQQNTRQTVPADDSYIPPYTASDDDLPF